MSSRTPISSDRPRPPIEAGSEVAAFRPRNFDEAWRLSVALSEGATSMIPDVYRGSPGAVFAALAKGAELGLSPMAALGSIAVINGRATLWGDALPALVRREGHTIEEWLTGDTREDWVAHCRIKRRDTGETIVRSFSWSDAIMAGLAKKPGPWQQYPKRMLQMRARGFAVRDGVAEIMVGLGMAEEVMDTPKPPRDITPRQEASHSSIIAALPEEDGIPEEYLGEGPEKQEAEIRAGEPDEVMSVDSRETSSEDDVVDGDAIPEEEIERAMEEARQKALDLQSENGEGP
jgi:hypothetical protein